jgi:hypothetical protein
VTRGRGGIPLQKSFTRGDNALDIDLQHGVVAGATPRAARAVLKSLLDVDVLCTVGTTVFGARDPE